MKKSYKFCQSCMMPFKADPQGGGTNSDGTRSALYCSYCYQNGQFIQPDMTMQQMHDFVVNKLVEMKYPRFTARFMTIGMGRLERWKK